MLSAEMINAVKNHTAGMKNDVVFVVRKEKDNDQSIVSKRAELIDFLQELVNAVPKLQLEINDDIELNSDISFTLKANKRLSGITFSGIPGGHEFTSLILAVLQLSGTTIKLDEAVQSMIASVKATLNFEVFVSLSCHNCPDIVQALNQFAIINDNISVEMIDGGCFPELVESRGIQGVPSVYLNGESFSTGKMNSAQILDKFVELHPEIKAGHAEVKVLPLQDVTIIGGGPAGVSAAIYAARKGLAVTMITDRIGGQVKDTMGIENMISYLKSSGPELSKALESHVKDYPVTIKNDVRVTEVIEDKIKKIVLNSGEVIESKTLIMATGAQWRKLGVPGETEYLGRGVAYCPHCDGPFFKGKDVAVIGGGNSGIEAALDLAGIVKSVTVIEFADTFKADKILLDQAKSRDNITLIANAATDRIEGDDSGVTHLVYKDRATNEEQAVELSGVFVQIGLVPQSELVQEIVDVTKHKEIIINERGETSVKGIYACGDVSTVPYKQIVIAMGEGAKAALSAFEYLLVNG